MISGNEQVALLVELPVVVVVVAGPVVEVLVEVVVEVEVVGRAMVVEVLVVENEVEVVLVVGLLVVVVVVVAVGIAVVVEVVATEEGGVVVDEIPAAGEVQLVENTNRPPVVGTNTASDLARIFKTGCIWLPTTTYATAFWAT
jgi:hypothetical protein